MSSDAGSLVATDPGGPFGKVCLRLDVTDLLRWHTPDLSKRNTKQVGYAIQLQTRVLDGTLTTILSAGARRGRNMKMHSSGIA